MLFENIVKVVRGIVKLRGGTDNTLIGNSSDSLKVISVSEKTNNTAIPTQSTLVSGSDGTNIVPLAVDSLGRLVTTALTGFNSGFSTGYVDTAAVTEVRVRNFAYIEQKTNAQRSIVSTNANDSSAGTGARTVKVTYLDQTGAGPFTETITLNGLTPVNTVSTTICYVEKIEVITAGSTGSNVGAINFRTTTAGGGSTFVQILATQNTTFMGHHYVPINKTLKITGVSCSHNGTTVGSGAVFKVYYQLKNSSVAAILQVSDFIRLYGQSSTFSRAYQSPITVVGPAIVYLTVAPESSSSFQYRAAMDYFEP